MASKLTATKPDEEKQNNADAGAMPTKKAVTTLSSTVRSLDQKMSKLRGEKGSAIKTASDDENVHKGAFREAMKRLAMEPDERANYQRHVAKYERDLDIELQGDLLKDAPQEPKKSTAKAETKTTAAQSSPAH